MDKDPSEIVKLTERIAKDPKSKLFVPLAEEYKKAGDIEMSIYVLNEGLKNNPGYVTARSFLGKLLIEKGDLPAAQKEFEEVVKAIPDNLMAQKKLGDLYALQDRIADAVSRYKLALALNPKDAEVGFLIKEAEAGRDIKKHLPKIKTAPAEDKQKKEQGPVVSVASQPPAGSLPGLKPQQKPSGRAPAAAAQEEPEEVLFVEPLDAPAEPVRATVSEIPDLLAERDTEPAASGGGMEHEQDDALFAVNDSLSPGGQYPGLEEPVALADTEEAAETAAPFEEEREKQADDFTTDTLAELYISQGFYEKAVDIYERMLVDKPNSRKLVEKLAKVRAMASSAAGDQKMPQAAAQKPLSLDESQDLGPGTAATEAEFPAAVPPPALDDWELPSRPLQLDDEVQAGVAAPPGEVDFEPREYVPPPAFSPEDRGEETGAQAAKPVGHIPKQSLPFRGKPPGGRKETIARLESWLKNIKKET